MSKVHLISDLLVSMAGVLIFVGINHFIDLNGYTRYAPIIILMGLGLIVFINKILAFTQPIKLINKSILKSISYVLIFIGAKTYLNQFIEGYWIVYLIIGFILLNNHQQIAEGLFRG